MIEFPMNRIKVRNTYWGANPSEVHSSEDEEKWVLVGDTPSTEEGDHIYFYDGSLFNTSCRLEYIFTNPRDLSLMGINYCFIRPSPGLWQTIEVSLTEAHGPPLRGPMYEKDLIWLDKGDLTSIRLGAKVINNERTTCIFVRYNGEGTNQIIDHYEKGKKELP